MTSTAATDPQSGTAQTSSDGLVPLRPAVANLPAYVPGARPAEGVKVHRLASNENPYPPLPSVLDALSQVLGTINRYPDMAAVELHEALADFISAGRTRSFAPENIAIGTGSVAVLQHIMAAFVEPGDEVVYPWRSFEAYPIVVDVVGGTSVHVPLNDEHAIDMAALAAAVTERTRVVVVCTPNNPTGTAVSHAELEQLLAQVPSHVLVVIDEAYLEFVGGDDPVQALDLLDEYRNVVVLRTLSKAYGLAGLRVGYAVGDPRLIEGIRATSTPFGVSSVAQHAAVLSLAAHEELQQRVDELVQERARLVAALTDQGWELPQTQANFVWFPLGDEATDFAQAAREHGILVRPFAGEGVRVSVGDRDDNDALLAFTARWRSR
ncbi:histidinol-phosphate aminotransferase [Micrococcales bacterium KH10]|nr:histidinol-phosphate aminotransferase [Micrococcales bacterium KH10]